MRPSAVARERTHTHIAATMAPMTRTLLGLVVCASVTLAFVGCDRNGGAQAGGGASSGAGLDATWTPAKGDLIAERAVGRLRLKGVLNAPMSAHYDRAEKLIVIDVGGARDKVEDCKETIEKIRSVVMSEVKPLVSKEFGVDLSESDLQVVYSNRDTGKEIVRLERGKWLLAGP